MNPLELVLAIVVVVFVARFARDRLRYQAEAAARVPEEDVLRLAQEIQQLKERIQVLERVVTDSHGSIDLDREIERLRDR